MALTLITSVQPPARGSRQSSWLCSAYAPALGKAGKFFRRELAKEKQWDYIFRLGSAQELQDQLLLNVIWYCYLRIERCLRMWNNLLSASGLSGRPS